ncbi:MAG: SAP domain-containing protein [Aristaeellaceae bacterium]
MLIRIINGTYGHRPKLANGKDSPYVVPVTRNDPPIEVDEKEASRLVEAGIAEYVNVEEVATANSPSEQENAVCNTPENEGCSDCDQTPENAPSNFEYQEFTTDMRVDELRAAMRERGIALKIGMSKADMVNALNSAEDFPDLTAQDVVEE